MSTFSCQSRWLSPLPLGIVWILVWVAGAEASGQLRLLTPRGYLPQVPVLVRVEVTDEQGRRDWSLWDAEVELRANPPSLALSTNRAMLRHGVGSALVSFSGGGDFELVASFGDMEARRFLASRAEEPILAVGGVLGGTTSTWSGLILVTNDLIIPPGHTLTINSNTMVLINGVTNGVVAPDISVRGAIFVLGTETDPVTLTCAEPDRRYRWGQIRHDFAQPSLYRFASITRGGRAFGEGHTGTAPVFRPVASAITFEHCNITDHAEVSPDSPEFGQPGKVLQAALGCELSFEDCLLARSRMGLEVSESALQVRDSWVLDMRGTNDSDGLLLARQQAGQAIVLTGTVVAGGDDDGVDLEGASLLMENCIVRDWNNPLEDSKGVSLAGGETVVRRCLLVDNAVGISGKGDDGERVRLQVDHCTILAEVYALGATNKNGTSPLIEFHITNSIVRGVRDTIFTQYDPADIQVSYCNLGEGWTGLSNGLADPMFVNAGAHDYRLQPYSPCIDAGDPRAPADPDGSRTDLGFHVFSPPWPVLASPLFQPEGAFGFQLQAYPNRAYAIDRSTNLSAWAPWTVLEPTNAAVPVSDATAGDGLRRFYRARPAWMTLETPTP